MTGLYFIRQEYKLSLKEMADKLSVSNQIVSMWERKKKPIPQARLEELSKLFNVPTEYFQKDLTEIEKLNIQINKVNTHIDETAFTYEDQFYDDKTGKLVTVGREHYDQNAIEFLDSLKVDKKELQLIERLRVSINIITGGFNITEDSSIRDYTEVKEKNIELYDKFIDIVNSPNIKNVLIIQTLRAFELLDEQLSDKNIIWGEENPMDITTVSDEREIVQEIFCILRKYMIKQKIEEEQNIKDAEELIELFKDTDNPYEPEK